MTRLPPNPDPFYHKCAVLPGKTPDYLPNSRDLLACSLDLSFTVTGLQ